MKAAAVIQIKQERENHINGTRSIWLNCHKHLGPVRFHRKLQKPPPLTRVRVARPKVKKVNRRPGRWFPRAPKDFRAYSGRFGRRSGALAGDRAPLLRLRALPTRGSR